MAEVASRRPPRHPGPPSLSPAPPPLPPRPKMQRRLCALLLLASQCMGSAAGLFPFGEPDFSYKRSNCKPIPAPMLLCRGIEYQNMRLPNLLGHETVQEVLEQASTWIPLVQKQCHPDTRKFLCSLFAPVCIDDLDEIIQPCHSLCEEVKESCAPVMSAFGFPWPDMLDCSRFPKDNDLCIPLASSDHILPVTREGKRERPHLPPMRLPDSGVHPQLSRGSERVTERPVLRDGGTGEAAADHREAGSGRRFQGGRGNRRYLRGAVTGLHPSPSSKKTLGFGTGGAWHPEGLIALYMSRRYSADLGCSVSCSNLPPHSPCTFLPIKTKTFF